MVIVGVGVIFAMLGLCNAESSAAVPLPAQYNCTVTGNSPNCAMPGADSPVCQSNSSRGWCFIWEPKVKNDPSHPPPVAGYESYNAVAFAPGDQVTLYANGCAQAGGSGQTWHRYVHPHDNQHWGAADIVDVGSGAFELGRPTQFVNGGSPPINIGHPSVLQLYYNDDPGAYGDNGYWGFDGGDVNECSQSNGGNFTVNDNYGGPAYVYAYIQHDTNSPGITIGSPSGATPYYRGQSVPASFSCSPSVGWVMMTSCNANDDRGGVLNGGLIDTSSIGTKSFTVTAADSAGRTNSQTIHYTVRDVTPPSIVIHAPVNGASFMRGQHVAASYGCQDDAGGSGLQSCTGSVPVGSAIDTRTPGAKTFTVVATDAAGNRTTQAVVYYVQDYPTLPTLITFRARSIANGALQITNMAAENVVGNSRIVLSCQGRGCPRHLKTIHVRRSAGQLTIRQMIGRRLQPGTVLRVKVLKPGTIGRLTIFRIKPHSNLAETNCSLYPGRPPGPCTRG